MLSDPQSVTVNAVPQSMPRVGVTATSGHFQKDDGTYVLKLAHQDGKRLRHQIRLDFNKVAADPFDTTLNQKVSASVYLVVDRPANQQGYTNAEIKLVTDGFLTYLQASSGAVMTALLGKQV